jgi:predicted flavoprotein YhiN
MLIMKDLVPIHEILDVDGDCGGFNLQWAWSSGWLAGSSAASN